MTIRVIAPSYYRGYYRDTEFYDLIVATGLGARAVYPEKLCIRIPKKKNFRGGWNLTPRLSPLRPLPFRLNFERNLLVRALKTL